MDNRYRSRKYSLAMFFALANTTALFFNFMDANAYVLGQGVILGMYNASNVMKDKK